MAGETQQTNQSSQGGSSQSGSQTQAASDGASGSSQATAGQTQQQTQQSQAPTKPEWAPDNFWDPTKGELKGKEFRGAFDELAAFKAADDVKRLALPAKPEDYKLALPKDFKPPEGVEFKLDDADPLFAQARTWAKENGLSQDAFEKGIGLIAARDVSTQQMLTNAKNAEIAKLGANGPARVTAINTFLDAKGYTPLKGMMVTAEIVQTVEKLISDMTSAGTFSQQHRDSEPVAKVSDEEWGRMSFSERREYAAKHANGRAA